MGARALSTSRLYAVAALVVAAGALALTVITAVLTFPRGLLVAVCFTVAAGGAWVGLLHRGLTRAAAFAGAVLGLATACGLLLTREPALTLLTLVALGLTLVCARLAFRVRLALPAASPPRHGVLFFNPRSGDGKAARFHLADEARARGLMPVELTPGSDLKALVNEAIASGADGLAMAGGDGSQAVVAAAAAEHGLPYACIPAGTRNHFALDLGVDRDDVVGALDAFVNGGERWVDLAEVNGRVFVNNVSLGVYGDAVQKPGYREAKLRTLMNVVPDEVAAETGPRTALSWREPDGAHQGKPSMLVSNDRYRLGSAIRSGTRPRLDEGQLGVAVFELPGPGAKRPLREWSAPELEVASQEPVPAGIDGEATVLNPPLRFRSHRGVLRVRIAPRHPGASPSALEPGSAWAALRALAGIAAGHDPRQIPARPEPQ